MYVDSYFDREADKIYVSERVNGKRRLLVKDPSHVFYTADANGKYKTIFGDRCRKFASNESRKFWGELKKTRDSGSRIFESDINPVFRHLADNYTGAALTKMNICFFDIEADYDLEKGGFAPSHDPFNAVTAISFYLTHEEKLFCFALLPPTVSEEEGNKIVSGFENTFLFTDEKEMLEAFLSCIDNVDVFSGWSSEQYDIPYLVNRITMLLGKEATKKFCLWDQYPRPREYKSKFGSQIKTYDLVGKVHLDYIQLYQKHNTQQRLSYKLDSVGEDEVGENKVPYEGRLDELYRNDFDKFIAYSRQDVGILVKIDKKLQFIDRASQVAHQNCVTLKTTMGSVVLVEQAIINYMHKMGMVVPDKKKKEEFDELDGLFEIEDEKKPVVGAYVADPKIGLHRHIGCVDINSLYPSAIRALNMSPETIVGQIRPTETQALVAQRIADGVDRADAWEGIFMLKELEHMHAEDDAEITIDFEDGREWTLTGAELYDYIFNPANKVCISANGTIFRTDLQGIIPSLLAEWYAERKEYQSKAKEFTFLGKGLNIAPDLADEIRQYFKEGVEAEQPLPQFSHALDKVLHDKDPEKIADFLHANNLVLVGVVIRPRDVSRAEEHKAEGELWDQMQYARKILLNSLYGALLNSFMRFFDERLGQSTTLTGRCIVKHMNASINETITGINDYRGNAILYSDTDSSYFSAYEYLKDDPEWADFDWSKENIIEMYDGIADEVNKTFSPFMQATFNTNAERGSIIKAGRELVASSGLFIKKKKYAVLMYDKEGTRLDVGGKPGKMKIMGLDLKRADTPKFMQKFLESLLMDILTGADQQKMYDDVKNFRSDFKERPSWEKGSPKKVADLTKYEKKVQRSDSVGVFGKLKAGEKLKVNMPGHVRASMNWNKLCDMYDDHYSSRIVDGTRIIVCKLRPNTMKMDSVAFPMDQPHLPQWFKELPFDDAGMEEVIINKKLMNLVGVLSWDLNETVDRMDDDLFSFGDEPTLGHNGGPVWDGGDDGDFDEDE